jgi:hypothetical protein
MTRKRIRVQEARKRFDGRCFFCGESDYNLLHAHRILPGESGGKYHWLNILTTCPTCHAKIHAGRIVIHGRYSSTLGVHFIHWTEDGKEHWEREDARQSR